MELFFFISRPGKVMEIDSRFWKIHKKSWKLKCILSRNGVVPFFHPAFQYKDTLLKSDQILVSYTSSCIATGSQRQNPQELVAPAGACGLCTCRFHATKKVLDFNALVMEKSWKKY